MHTNEILEIKIDNNMQAIEVCDLIAKQINLLEFFDFKLFIVDKELKL